MTETRVPLALIAAAVVLCGCAGGAAPAPAPEHYADMFGVWSPDGEKIALVSDRGGDPPVLDRGASATRRSLGPKGRVRRT